MPTRITADLGGTNEETGGFNAAVSANGRFVAHTAAYWNDDVGETFHEVVLHDRTTGVSTRLTQSDNSVNAGTEGTYGDVAISGDGRIVAFVSDVPQLTDDDQDPSAWSMDWEDIYIHDAAAGETVRLNASGELDALLGDRVRMLDVAISADGNTLAFAAADRFGEHGGNGDVFVYDRATGAARKVGEAGSTVWDETAVELQLSANGGHAFFRLLGTGPLVHVDLATDAQTTLEDVVVWNEGDGTSLVNSSYAVSADGLTIAYMTTDRAGVPQVAVYDRATGETEQITAGLLDHEGRPHQGVLNPSISADGRFVLFASAELDDLSPAGRLDLYVLDRTTGEVENLTANGADHLPRPGSYMGHFAADGKTIVVESTGRLTSNDDDEATDLYVLDNPFAGGEQPNDPPTARDDAFTVGEDDSIALDVLVNDVDPDGDHLIIVETEGPAAEAGSLWTDADGTLRYSPGSALQGLKDGETGTDSFTYTIRDATGLEASASVTITVTGANDAPVLNPDVVTVSEDDAVTVTAAQLTANDFDADGDALTLVGVAEPADGAVTFDAASQSFTFTPDAKWQSLREGQSATRTMSYTVRDAEGVEEAATLVLNITGANDAPEARADAFAVDEDATSDDLAALLLGNDADVDAGDTRAIVAVGTTGTKGIVHFDPKTGVLRYEARGFDALAPGETATDTFTYTMRDGAGATSTATATVTVRGAAEPPRIIWGTEWDDLIEGSDAADEIHALGDDDTVYGHGGGDVLLGEDGNDRLFGGGSHFSADDGKDWLSGGAGDDALFGGSGDAVIDGGAGDDTAHLEFGQEAQDLRFSVIDVLQGAVTVAGVTIAGIERVTFFGGAGDDILQGGYGWDAIYGGAGDDHLLGDHGWDILAGGQGDDTISAFGLIGGSIRGGDAWNDHGTDEAQLRFKDTADVFSVVDNLAGEVEVAGFEISGIETVWLKGEGGDDQLIGGAFGDTIEGGAGHDRLRGEGGDDRLYGGDGDDVLVGAAGRDQLSGGAGDDWLYADEIPGTTGLAARALAAEGGAELDGGAGDDTLHAGAGATLAGGEGRDVFVLDGADGGATVADLGAGDVVDVSALLVRGADPFATGHLRLEARNGATALVLDADGSAGGGTGLDLALLAGVAPSSLTAASFVATGADGAPVVVDPAGLPRVVGTAKGDKLTGTAKAELIEGLGGNDLAWGKGGNDRIEGGAGLDGLFGDDGADLLLGGEGWDALDGGRGDDRLDGGSGRDALSGGDGADTLVGGTGDDALHGGAGADRFVFAAGDGRDVVLDFRAGKGLGEVIELRGTEAASFEELMASVTTNRQGHAVIELGHDDGLTLSGVRKGQLVADDFVFAGADGTLADLVAL